MAHALSITDGTTTISLSDGTSWILLHYTPNNPSYRNGAYDPVTDSIELSTNVATGLLAQTATNSVQKLLQSARRRFETKSGAKVYLQITLDGEGQVWRSEIHHGALVGGNDLLRAWQGIQPQTLIIERSFYWEGEQNILVSSRPLINTSGSNSYYTASAVEGVLPTPPIVQLTNPALPAGSQTQRDIYFGINAFNAPSTFDGTLSGGTLTDTAPYTWTTQKSYALSNAQLAALHGDNTRFVAAHSGPYTGSTWYKITQYALNEVAATEPIYPLANDSDLLDLGTMRIPTGGYYTDGTGVSLYFKTQSSSTNLNLPLTFIQMFPADNMRHYEMVGQLLDTDSIVDDGIEGSVYEYDFSQAKRLESVAATGSKLMLYPGQAHRFIWLMGKSTGYTAGDTSNLTVTYRPRRLTI